MIEAHKFILADLADKLAATGVCETPQNIQDMIARDGFKALFFLQCLEAVAVRDARLGD